MLANAVWSGSLADVDAAIVAGVDVNAADGDRLPPLFLAIEQRHVEIVRHLIAAGADVNRDSGQGWTPLVHAIDIESDAAHQAGRLPEEVSTVLTELLLAAGAMPTDRAIAVAEGYGNHKALALLRQGGVG